MAQLVCATMEHRATMVVTRWFHHDFVKDLFSLWHLSSPTLLIFLVHVCIAPQSGTKFTFDSTSVSPLNVPPYLSCRLVNEPSFHRHRVCFLLHRAVRYHCDASESSRQLRPTVTGNGRSSIFSISHLHFSNYGSLSFLHIYIYIYESSFICFLLRYRVSSIRFSQFICRSKWLVSSSTENGVCNVVDGKGNLQIMGS